MAKPLYTEVSGPLKPKHYMLFGRIITYYAHLEIGLRITLAGFLGHDLAAALILSAPYSSANLRNVVKSYTKLMLAEGNIARDLILEATGVLKAHGQLRNDIAHNMWLPGHRNGSVRPMYLDIRGDKAVMRGMGDDAEDYLIDDLEAAANKLASINGRLVKFQATPEFQASITRYSERSRQASEASEGSS